MFSRSCAGHTISTSEHQWSFWPGDRWRHVFGPRLHFYALSAIRIRRPSCYNVRAFPECSNDWLPRARWNTRNARFANVLTCLLFRCSLVVHACPHVKRSSAIFHWNCNFYNARKSMFSGSVIFTRQKKHCNFYTGIAIFTLPGKLSFAV